MADKDPKFPGIEEGDSDDVRWALETAGAMWDQGDKDGSLRWLKRASDAASDEGEDIRSVRLAKARAELRSFLDLSGQAAEAAAKASAEAPPAKTPPPAPAEEPAPKRRPPPPQRGAAAASPPPARSDAPAPAGTPEPAPAAPPARQSAPAPPARQSAPAPQPAPEPAAPDMEDEPTLQRPLRAEDLALELQQKLAAQGIPIDGDTPAAATGLAGKLAKHQAVRVSIQPMNGVPGVMLARPLAEGEQPGTGAQVALLVALEANQDLVGESS